MQAPVQEPIEHVQAPVQEPIKPVQAPIEPVQAPVQAPIEPVQAPVQEVEVSKETFAMDIPLKPAKKEKKSLWGL